MDWFLSIIRVAGASFPLSSSLVQLHSEMDAKSFSNRLTKLEDPISHLHKDIPEISRILYQKLKDENTNRLHFGDEFYSSYSRSLAILETNNYIKGSHAIGKRFGAGLFIIDPTYIMYMCVLEEDAIKMNLLVEIVDECKIGQSLNGKQIEIDVPLPVIKAVFDVYESKGFGISSKMINCCQYQGIA